MYWPCVGGPWTVRSLLACSVSVAPSTVLLPPPPPPPHTHTHTLLSQIPCQSPYHVLVFVRFLVPSSSRTDRRHATYHGNELVYPWGEGVELADPWLQWTELLHANLLKTQEELVSLEEEGQDCSECSLPSLQNTFTQGMISALPWNDVDVCSFLGY